MSSVRTNNRIIYINPNENKDGATNFYPYQPDSLMLFVNLTVCVPDRDGSKNVYNEPVCNISFMGGTEFTNPNNSKEKVRYLTTNYTDIDFSNPNSNTHECLGIESATISYDTWMVPTVTIKFVDVRGASLFGPEAQDITNKTSESFFKAIFAFPSPLFKLEVKGYLGRSVTYNLKISKYDGQLNANTGCFEATIDFIGYMYGIYADMPMSYLALAPHTTEGSKYWETSNFQYSDGTRMKKLEEFVECVSKIKNNNPSSVSNNEDKKKKNQNLQKISQLNELLTQFNNVIDNIEKSSVSGHTSVTHKTVSIRNQSNISFITRSVFSGLTAYPSYESFHSKVETYSPEIPLPKSVEPNKVLNGKDFNGDEINSDVWNTLSEEEKALIKSYKSQNKTIPDEAPFYLYTNFCQDFVSYVREKISNIEKENEKLKERIDDAAKITLNWALGFPNTMPNIYRMLFAHMDTFVHLMNTCVNNIHSNPRTIESLGWNKSNTDLRQDYTGYIPPFTLFLKEGSNGGSEKTSKSNGNKTILWPGSIPGNENMEEVKLVEELLKAIDYCKNNETIPPQTELPLAENTARLPITVNDWFYLDTNPYSYIFGLRAEEWMNYTISTFGIRLMNFALFNLKHQYGGSAWNEYIEDGDIFSDSEYDIFGLIEAYNFYKGNPNLSKDDIEDFCRNITPDSILEYLTSTDTKNLLHSAHGALFTSDSTVLQRVEGSTEYEYTWGKQLKENSEDYKYWLPVKDSKPEELPESYNDNTWYTLVELEGENLQKGMKLPSDWNYVIKFETKDETLTKYNNILDSVCNTCELTGETKTLYANMSLAGNRIFQGHLTTSSNLSAFKDLTGFDSVSDLLNLDEEYYKAFTGMPKRINNKITDELRFIFGDRIYYEQEYTINDSERIKEEDENLVLLRKAYCFIITNIANYDLKKGVSMTMPTYGCYLAKGAYAWRVKYLNEWSSDPINDEKGILPLDYGTDLLLNNGCFEAQYLINVFEEWAASKFIWIKTAYEIPDFYNIISNTTKTSIIQDAYFVKVDENNGNKIYATYEIKNSITYDGDVIKDWKELAINKVPKTYLDKKENIGLVNSLKELFTTPLMLSPVTNGYSRKRIDGTYVSRSFKIFIDTLNTLYSTQKEKTESFKDRNKVNTDDIKLSVYLTLKNLYENWFAGNPNTTHWKLSDEKSQFNAFKYVDSFLRDIGDQIYVNAQKVSELISREIPSSNINNTNQEIISKSLYSMLADIAQNTGMVLMAFPTFDSWIKYTNEMSDSDRTKNASELFSDIFKPTQVRYTKDYDGSTYLCVWPGEASSHLDITNGKNSNINNYDNDGFDIIDSNDNIIEIPALSDNSVGNYMVPIFLVDYGNQNQGIFKNISVGMSNPQTTEASLKSLFSIASNESERGSFENSFAGQDLFRVYNNYSYTCKVEAIGNVQIMPMMYFQLIHIPMFHGVYQIIKVEHSIQSGEMVTEFTGVRVSKNQIPYVYGAIGIIPKYGIGGRSDYSPIYGGSWNAADGDEKEPIYLFYDKGSSSEHDKQEMVNNEPVADSGKNWKIWLSNIKNNPPENGYFAFGASVRNRVNFYKTEYKSYHDDYHRCARAVREYAQCCTHKILKGGNGWDLQKALTDDYYAITDDTGKYITPEGNVVDITNENGRTIFTNKWALNGDICVYKPQRISTPGHACMFITGFPFEDNKKRWVSDYVQEEGMWVYGGNTPYSDGNIVFIKIFRHKSKLEKQMIPLDKFQEEYEAPLSTIGQGATISIFPCTIAPILKDYFKDKLFDESESDKMIRLKCIIAGIIGCLHQESRLNWNAHNSGAEGIAQWRGDRKTVNFREFLKTHSCNFLQMNGEWKTYKPGEAPIDTTILNCDLTTQVNYLVYELDNSYKTAVTNELLSTENVTPIKMADIFVRNYEKPGDYDNLMDNYFQRARYYYNHGSSDSSGTTTEDNWWYYKMDN